jgi:hypothetical protein
MFSTCGSLSLLLASCLLNTSSALKMEAGHFSVMPLTSTQHHIPEDGAFLNKLHEDHVSFEMLLGSADI